MGSIAVKRIYEDPAPSDGCRVLVDRLWPRGMSKERAALDHWFRNVAPSNELRRWYGHDPAKWDEFRRRYRAELEANEAAVSAMRDLVEAERSVTLLFGSKETRYNNAVALAEYLRGH